MQKVAFIGVGTMGMGMLSNLLKHGFEVVAFDLSASALEKASSLGAHAAHSAAAAAQSADIVITMLPTAESVDAVYRGGKGLEAGLGSDLRAGQVCIDMSTIDPGRALRLGHWLAERDIDFLDCPVSGGQTKAWDGTLTIMAGGSEAAFQRVRPLLESMGGSIVLVGGNGAGAAAKLANNIVAAASMVATAEAFQLAMQFGVDAEVLTRILATSSGETWVLHNMHPVPGILPDSPSSNDYRPGFSTVLMLEMLDLVRQAGVEKGIALSVVPAIRQLWELAANNGLADKDCTSVFSFIGPAGSNRAT